MALARTEVAHNPLVAFQRVPPASGIQAVGPNTILGRLFDDARHVCPALKAALAQFVFGRFGWRLILRWLLFLLLLLFNPLMKLGKRRFQ